MVCLGKPHGTAGLLKVFGLMFFEKNFSRFLIDYVIPGSGATSRECVAKFFIELIGCSASCECGAFFFIKKRIDQPRVSIWYSILKNIREKHSLAFMHFYSAVQTNNSHIFYKYSNEIKTCGWKGISGGLHAKILYYIWLTFPLQKGVISFSWKIPKYVEEQLNKPSVFHTFI